MAICCSVDECAVMVKCREVDTYKKSSVKSEVIKGEMSFYLIQTSFELICIMLSTYYWFSLTNRPLDMKKETFFFFFLTGFMLL